MRVPKRGRELLLEEPPKEVPNPETMGVVLLSPSPFFRERERKRERGMMISPD